MEMLQKNIQKLFKKSPAIMGHILSVPTKECNLENINLSNIFEFEISNIF